MVRDTEGGYGTAAAAAAPPAFARFWFPLAQDEAAQLRSALDEKVADRRGEAEMLLSLADTDGVEEGESGGAMDAGSQRRRRLKTLALRVVALALNYFQVCRRELACRCIEGNDSSLACLRASVAL